MLNYNIRKAEQEDAKELNKLLNKLMIDEKKYDKNINDSYIITKCYENQLTNDNICAFVCEIDSKIIGYIFGYIIENEAYIEEILKLDALYIEKEYQHNGIGTALINEFKSFAKSQNIKYIELSVLNNNENAKKLYNKCGFKNFKSIMNIEI